MLVFAAASIWSLLAVVIYLAISPILDWLGANAGGVISGGKNIATAAGADKNVMNAIDGIDLAGASASLLNLTAGIAKPAVVVIWLLGMAAILAVPFITRKLGNYFGMKRRDAGFY
ncbi:hypothetical protein [Labrys neptuniae]